MMEAMLSRQITVRQIPPNSAAITSDQTIGPFDQGSTTQASQPTINKVTSHLRISTGGDSLRLSTRKENQPKKHRPKIPRKTPAITRKGDLLSGITMQRLPVK